MFPPAGRWLPWANGCISRSSCAHDIIPTRPAKPTALAMTATEVEALGARVRRRGGVLALTCKGPSLGIDCIDRRGMYVCLYVCLYVCD